MRRFLHGPVVGGARFKQVVGRSFGTSAKSLFDPSLHNLTRLPLGEARSLPGETYFSKDWYDAEVDKLLKPSWVLAGHASEFKEKGHFIKLDMPGGASALLVRGKDDVVRAWANVCTHRGAQLASEESGRFAAGIVCPYHAWTYDPTSGALKGVTKSEQLSPCFDKKEWPLRAMQLAEYKGFFFVTSSEATPPLSDSLGNIDIAVGDWRLEDFVTVGRAEYHVECNWKFLMQNTSETYHTSYVHKDSLGPMPSEPIGRYLGIEPVGDWTAVHVPGDRSIVPLPGEAAPFPELATHASTYFISIFPTLQLNVTRDCAWWMRVLPTSISTTRVTQGFLFPRETASMDNFDALVKPYFYRWDLAVREDNDISLNQQIAARNPHHRPGPYHGLEFAVHRFDNMVLDGVLREQLPLRQPSSSDQELRVSGQQGAHVSTTPKLQRLTQPMVNSSLAASMSSSALGAHRHLASSITSQFAGMAPGASVCVTGANGFIALHLVGQLLAAGYRVTAAVRTADAAKLAPLQALGELGELEVVSGCDLLTPGSFDAAVAGAEVCFHTASPFWMDGRITDPWQQLVQPAVCGTINVLDACGGESSSVRRVVLTSSFAALMNVGGRTPWAADFQYSEEHWNVSSAPDADGTFPEPVNAHAYRWSKTAAERAAWSHRAVASGKLDLVTILPPMVLGENKQTIRSVSDLNQSSLILHNLLSGKMEHVMPGSVGFVDVADVARSHILGAQVAAAGGERYLCSGESRTWLEIADILRKLYPSAPLPTTCSDGSTTQPCLLLKNDKIKAELGMEFLPLEKTLKAQCSALERAGLLQL